MADTAIARLFTHGRSQAVRLPKEFRLPGDRVRVRHVGEGVLLEPIAADLDVWFAAYDLVIAAQALHRDLTVVTANIGEFSRVTGLNWQDWTASRAHGWTVCVVATPQALKFLDVPALARQTGFAVRSEYKRPGAPDVLPAADAMIVGGASFNTINKWAQGIADNLVLGLLTEAIGLGLPLVALPFLNAAQAAHPAFYRSVKELRYMGVTVLVDDEGYPPHSPHQGAIHLREFPWGPALAAVERKA